MKTAETLYILIAQYPSSCGCTATRGCVLKLGIDLVLHDGSLLFLQVVIIWVLYWCLGIHEVSYYMMCLYTVTHAIIFE